MGTGCGGAAFSSDSRRNSDCLETAAIPTCECLRFSPTLFTNMKWVHTCSEIQPFLSPTLFSQSACVVTKLTLGGPV